MLFNNPRLLTPMYMFPATKQQYEPIKLLHYKATSPQKHNIYTTYKND